MARNPREMIGSSRLKYPSRSYVVLNNTKCQITARGNVTTI
jgi:hypothetical protein